MVKIEGAAWLAESIRMLAERGVPVCAHMGLTPQSVNILGGYKVQGRNEAQARQMRADAIALEQAGAAMILLECVPSELAEVVPLAHRLRHGARVVAVDVGHHDAKAAGREPAAHGLADAPAAAGHEGQPAVGLCMMFRHGLQGLRAAQGRLES